MWRRRLEQNKSFIEFEGVTDFENRAGVKQSGPREKHLVI